MNGSSPRAANEIYFVFAIGCLSGSTTASSVVTRVCELRRLCGSGRKQSAMSISSLIRRSSSSPVEEGLGRSAQFSDEVSETFVLGAVRRNSL